MDLVTVARSYAKLNQTAADGKSMGVVFIVSSIFGQKKKKHSHKMLNCITFPLKIQ